MAAWLLGLTVFVGIAALVYSLFQLRHPQPPAQRRRYRWLAVVAIATLAGTAWFGWPGPFGGYGAPQGSERPDQRSNPAAEGDLWLAVARDALGPDRRTQERIQASPDGLEPGVVSMILRAEDVSDPDALRRGIRRDAWRVFRAIFEHPQLDWINEVRIVVTHPSGQVPGPYEGEAAVAELRLGRERFQRLYPPGVDPEYLDEIADVWWLPPLGS